MADNITKLKPEGLWNCFHELTQIPRPSKHEDKALQHILEFGQRLGLEARRDNAGNVIIRKPATPGMENRKGVILQGHADMVPQKNADKKHDFLTDPISTIICDGWVKADNTTLGADNGIGVAAAMAVLADKSLRHGPIELLVTRDEETSMAGATALQPGELNGKILLNLDSEQEGEIYIGCAGGLDVNALFRYASVQTAEDDIAIKVTINGLNGGHSGMDIALGRANANKLLFRFLKFAAANYEAMLADVHGGDMRNAIPREAYAVLTIDSEDKDDFFEAVEEFEDMFRAEYQGVEPNLSFTAQLVSKPATVMDEMSADDLINAVHGCPNGVIRMSPDMDNLVETSSNLAIVDSSNGQTKVQFLVRSSIDTAKDDIASSIESICRLAGAEVEMTGEYPGWKPDTSSQIVTTLAQTYQTIFGQQPQIRAIHAGLECGIMVGAYPDWDMVSFGPTIQHPHSPSERVNIKSVENFWKLLTTLLENIPEE